MTEVKLYKIFFGAENDQAQCRDINVKEGIYDNVSNQYYWRLVVGVGDDI